MLVENSWITLDGDGRECPVQDLAIADMVFDPLGGVYDEITDILTRRVPCTDPRHDRLAPVLIGKGQLFSGRPRRDLALSPEQVVLMTDLKGPPRMPPVLSCYPAKDLSHDRAPPGAAITYFAIFFDRPRFMEVGGVLVSAYTLKDLCYV